jgi:excisionase family DNA binding protein
MPDSSDTPLLTSREVMQYLNVSRTTLWRLTKDGLLPAYRIGSDFRFRKTDINAYLERQKVTPDDKSGQT